MTEMSNNHINGIPIHGPDEFAKMRIAGQMAARTLDYLAQFVEPGVSSARLNKLCEDYIIQNGAKSATIGYKGYQHATCISPNHVICHGIPNDDPLQNGDIINIDVTVIVDGWYGDSSRMYFVGDKIPVKAKKLVDVTYECMMRGIEAVKPGATVGDIGYAIQSYAESHRYSVVRDFCGHGLGRVFHCPPSVVHFGRPGEGDVLHPGMFFTIEPMINAGRYESKVLADGWTAVTRDRSLSAQFEHSVAVTETGFEIFTLSPTGFDKPPYKNG